MTNDELENLMKFIVERQAETAERMAEMNARQAAMLERQADHDERITRFERSYTVIAGLLEKHDTQIEDVTTAVNRLTATVERYITERGDKGNRGRGEREKRKGPDVSRMLT